MFVTRSEEKTRESEDGSQVIPMDVLKAELFYPERDKNKATGDLVEQMAVDVADCILTKLRDPKKVTSNYLSSSDGEFSWGKTTEQEHAAGIGMMATNDPAESPFAALTQQLQSFGRVMGMNASAVGHARLHGDLDRSITDGVVDGSYHQLPKEMKWLLMELALGISAEVRHDERRSLKRQQEEKQRKQEMLGKKMIAAQCEYTDALTYIQMYHSPAC